MSRQRSNHAQAQPLRIAAKAQEARTRATYDPFKHLYIREAFDWVPCDAPTLADGIAGSLRAGNAITFSATPDGGAVKVTVWVEGQKYTAYAANAEALNELMAALTSPPEGVDVGPSA